MEHRRVHITQRYTRKASNQRHELIEVRRPGIRNDTAYSNRGSAEDVLRPLDAHACFAGAGLEEACLHDAHGGEELKRHGEEDGRTVEELDDLQDTAVWKVEQDDSLDIRAEGQVGHGSTTTKKDCEKLCQSLRHSIGNKTYT